MFIHAMSEHSFTSRRSTSIAFLYAKFAQAENAFLRSDAKIRLGIGKEGKALFLAVAINCC